MMTYNDYLMHHGIKGMKWGKTQGPPYPLTDAQRSDRENRLNPTSDSAKRLARLGPDNRFVQAKLSGGGGGSSSNNDSKKDSDSKSSGSGTYAKDLTRERRLEILKAKYPEKYGEKAPLVAPAAEEKTTKKSSSKSTKSAEEKAKEAAEKAKAKAEKERLAAEKAEKKEREQWQKDGKKAVDEAFGSDISTRSFKDLLDEFYNGAFSKNFEGKEDAELEKLLDENGNDIEETEGQKFYRKLMSRLDPKSEKYEEFKTRYDEIMSDKETTSMNRLSKVISILTDYADTLESKNRSEENKIYTNILGYLDSKLKWYNDHRTASTAGKVTLNGIQAYGEIEEYLKKHGF